MFRALILFGTMVLHSGAHGQMDLRSLAGVQYAWPDLKFKARPGPGGSTAIRTFENGNGSGWHLGAGSTIGTGNVLFSPAVLLTRQHVYAAYTGNQGQSGLGGGYHATDIGELHIRTVQLEMPLYITLNGRSALHFHAGLAPSLLLSVETRDQGVSNRTGWNMYDGTSTSVKDYDEVDRSRKAFMPGGISFTFGASALIKQRIVIGTHLFLGISSIYHNADEMKGKLHSLRAGLGYVLIRRDRNGSS